MSRAWKIAVAVVVVVLIFAVMSIPALVRSVLGLRRASATAEQQRRSIIQSPISTPTDTRVTAQLFWASPTVPGMLSPPKSNFRSPPILCSARSNSSPH